MIKYVRCKVSERIKNLIIPTSLAFSLLAFSYFKITEDSKAEFKRLANTPVKYVSDINGDGKNDIKIDDEFGGVVYIALPDGKYDKCLPSQNAYLSSAAGKRFYLNSGLMIDMEKSRLVDMVTGKGTELK